MTVEPMQAGGQLANPEDFGATGLEDFDVTDAVIPRLQLVHKEGVFKDNLSGLTYNPIRLIILGLVKQRILWHPEVEENDPKPMCRSNDFNTGFPNLELTGKRAFPWQKSGFDPNSVPMVNEQKPLPCANCQLKEWGSHPNGSTPYCSEQWTLPLYFDASGPEQAGNWMPALLSLQKSTLKPLRSYLTPFSRTGKAAFTAVCEVSLRVKTRGQVDYSELTFTQVGESDRSRWMEFSEQYGQMKGYLQQAPRSEDEDGEPTMSTNVNTAPAQQTYSDPNDPWATSTPPPAPSQPAAPPAAEQAPPPAPQQAAPQQPVQEQTPPPPPVQQPVQEQAPPPPPQQTAPPVQSQVEPPSNDPNGLPF